MAYKYVMMKAGHWDLPIIFPDVLTHAKVARFVKAMLDEEFAGVEVLSAGFVSDIDHAVAHGGSETLKLNAQEGDSRAINRIGSI